jgi:hypothetical protein
MGELTSRATWVDFGWLQKQLELMNLPQLNAVVVVLHRIHFHLYIESDTPALESLDRDLNPLPASFRSIAAHCVQHNQRNPPTTAAAQAEQQRRRSDGKCDATRWQRPRRRGAP